MYAIFSVIIAAEILTAQRVFLWASFLHLIRYSAERCGSANYNPTDRKYTGL